MGILMTNDVGAEGQSEAVKDWPIRSLLSVCADERGILKE